MILNFDTWKLSIVGEIFEKRKVQKYSKIPNNIGSTPFISSQSTNNGVAKTISDKNKFVCFGNCITVSTNGNCFDCFYHKEKIIISTDVEILYGDFLDENISLFLITILNKNSIKYNFGQKPKNNAVWKEKILLPTTKNGDPDWKYMHNYIKYFRERERESPTHWILFKSKYTMLIKY